MTAGNAIDVTEHRRLIAWVLRRRGLYRLVEIGLVDEADLVQQGFLGLLRAAELYDAELGSWSTYASRWVFQSVNRWVQDRARVVRVPVYLQDRRRAAGERVHPACLSLDAPVHADEDVDQTWHEVRSDPDATTPEDEADDRERAALLARLVWKAKLSPRERRVLALRSHGVTLDEIADELGVSRERVRQVERDALLSLRRAAGVRTDAPLSLAEPKNRKPTHRLETKAPCHMQQANQPGSASAI